MEYMKSCLKNKNKTPNQTTKTEKEGQLSTDIKNAQTATVKINTQRSKSPHTYACSQNADKTAELFYTIVCFILSIFEQKQNQNKIPTDIPLNCLKDLQAFIVLMSIFYK